MNLVTRKIYDFSSRPLVVSLAAISSIFAGLHLSYTLLSGSSEYAVSAVITIISLLFLLYGYAFSIQVRLENAALRDVSKVFHDINHIYRDTLHEVFGGDAPQSVSNEELMKIERRVLNGVCQRIRNIFSQVINRDCMATVKLVTDEDGNKMFAHTYVRSIEMCERDSVSHVYSVKTGRNTAFDTALTQNPEGKPLHFYGGDLAMMQKNQTYLNERQNFINYYKSAIVVPIMGNNRGHEGTSSEYDLYGFLCVDSMSRNRLNNGYHVYMLSSLAGQMFNFMSIMRGKYRLPSASHNIEEAVTDEKK